MIHPGGVIMNSHREFESIDAENFFNQATVDVAPTYAPRETRLSHEYSVMKTTKGVLLCLGGIGLAGLIVGGVGYANGISSALALKAETTGKVLDSGKAEIVHVSMDMPPITLATADTKVSGVKVAFEQKLNGPFNISIPLGSNTVTRDANVETLITVDPGKVNIGYDSKKEQLTFSAADTALTTKVDIPTGEARTVDKTGNIFMLPAEGATKLSEAIDGTFGTDNSKVPIIREMAAGTLGIDQGLEKYADLTIVTQVDSECTPLIPQKVKNFTEQLKDNIRIAVQGQLLDPEVTKNDVSSALKDMPLSKIQKLVQKSIVEMPENFTIGPDEDNISKLNDYKTSKLFTNTVDAKNPMACGVSKDTKLSLLDKATTK
jgi:hypothetical protein